MRPTPQGLRALWSWDLWIGLIAGGIAGGAASSQSVRHAGATVLIAEAAGGAAFLATVLTALGILVTQFDGPYRKILERAHEDGVVTALRPYYIVSAVSAIAAGIGILGALLWPAVSPPVASTLLALATGFTVWATVGMLQLVKLTIFHINSRSAVDKAMEAAAEARARTRGARTRSRSEHTGGP